MKYSITFYCETVTPMFMAGADGVTPELRPPSIKGALRFWWRAMHGHLLEFKNGHWNYELIKAKESEIFGDPGEVFGKSKVQILISEPLMDVSWDDLPEHRHQTYSGNSRNNRSFNINIIDYMAFGPVTRDKELKKNVLTRGYFKDGRTFKLVFKTDEKYANDVCEAFYMLAQHGGLGSKSRNGFGGFKIKRVETSYLDMSQLHDPEMNLTRIDDNFQIDLNSYCKTTVKPFTTLSAKCMIFQTDLQKNWHSALAILGRKYQSAREGFERWHDWYNREIIAMPIIVQKERNQDDNFLERHTKPYFFHVSKVAEEAFRGEILCLPYIYLQDHEKYSGKYLADYEEIISDFNKRLSLRNIK